MKKIITLGFFTALCFNTMAQGPLSKFKIGGGLSVVAPANNLPGYSIGVGFDLLGHFSVTSKVAITGDVGYTTIFAKNKDAKALNIIPIRAGLRFYPVNKFYLGGQAGVGIITGSGNSTSGFGYAVGGGFRMDDKLDIGLNYEGLSKKVNNVTSSLGYIGVRLGYFFN